MDVLTIERRDEARIDALVDELHDGIAIGFHLLDLGESCAELAGFSNRVRNSAAACPMCTANWRK